MDSKWKWPALKIARWGLQHGEFFDLYDVSYRLGISHHEAGKVMQYLRSLRHIEKQAETRSCRPEPGKMSARRIFIKVLAIHPEQAMTQKSLGVVEVSVTD